MRVDRKGRIVFNASMSGTKALAAAIKICGSTYKLAAALDQPQSTVSMWQTRGQVSWRGALGIERVTNGQVTRYQLRPDVYGKAPLQSAA